MKMRLLNSYKLCQLKNQQCLMLSEPDSKLNVRTFALLGTLNTVICNHFDTNKNLHTFGKQSQE